MEAVITSMPPLLIARTMEAIVQQPQQAQLLSEFLGQDSHLHQHASTVILLSIAAQQWQLVKKNTILK